MVVVSRKQNKFPNLRYCRDIEFGAVKAGIGLWIPLPAFVMNAVLIVSQCDQCPLHQVAFVTTDLTLVSCFSVFVVIAKK